MKLNKQQLNSIYEVMDRYLVEAEEKISASGSEIGYEIIENSFDDLKFALKEELLDIETYENEDITDEERDFNYKATLNQ